MNKLTPEQLVLLNRKIMADDEASIPQVNFDDLREITEIPYQKNEELFYIYRTAIEKAAKLGNLIVLRKPFVKANQETAVLALLTLLDINGYKMVNYSKDVEELCGYLEETKIDKVSLIMVGDALLHSSVYKDAYKGGQVCSCSYRAG